MSNPEEKAAGKARGAAPRRGAVHAAADPETEAPVTTIPAAEAPPSDTPETAITEVLRLDESAGAEANRRAIGARSSVAEETDRPHIPRPRIRWGAIVWGLIVCAIAAATLQVTHTSESREGFTLWLTRLTPGGIWLIVVLVAGGILLLLGLLAAIRRAQRAR